MKNYMAIYLGTPGAPGKPEMTDAQTQAGMQGWMKWATDNKASIIEMGGPLGKTKHVDKHGVSDIRNDMTAYTIVRAESHEAATKLFLNHPHFTIFPGDSVEIMEILPIPTL